MVKKLEFGVAQTLSQCTAEAPEPQPLVCQPAPDTQTSSVASYQPRPWLSSMGAECAPTSAPTLTPAEFQRLAADEKAKGAALRGGFASVKDALGSMIDEPSRENRLALANRLASSPKFQEMLKKVPREQVELALENLIEQRTPNASPQTRADLTKALTKLVSDDVKVQTAQTLKKAVAEQLSAAAAKFEKSAADPKALDAIMTALKTLETPPQSEAARSRAVSLREGLGLEIEGPVSPHALRDALLARAGLMKTEAEKVGSGGVGTLPDSLKLHSAVAGEVLERNGVERGSWAAAGPDLVRGEAGVNKDARSWSKAISSLALAASGAGALPVLGFHALDANAKWAEVGRSRAGVSAGTADLSAVKAATREAQIVTAEGLVSAAFAGKSGALLPHFEALSHTVEHVGVDIAFISGAAAAEHLLHPPAEGVEGDAISRATGK